MSDLRETLQMLGDTAPKIMEEMNTLVHQGTEVEKHADELLKLYEHDEQEAREVFDQIQHALAALKTDAAHHLAELNHELQAIEKGVHDLKELEHARDELKHGVEAAGNAMTSFQHKIDEGVNDFKHAHDEFKNALEEVKHGVEEGHNMLQDALHVTHDAAEALQHKVTDTKNNLGDLIENVLHNAMNQHQEETLHKVTDFLSQAHSLGEQFHQQSEDILNNIVKAKSHEVIELAKQKIEDQLKHVMDEGVEIICNAIQEMTDKVTHANEKSQDGRSGLKPLFEKAEEFLKPIESVINSIKDACEMVGISFG